MECFACRYMKVIVTGMNLRQVFIFYFLLFLLVPLILLVLTQMRIYFLPIIIPCHKEPPMSDLT